MKSNIKLCAFFLLTGILFHLSCQKEIPCYVCEENNKSPNKPPISIAGPDQAITLPTDSVLLDGSLSNDPDGRISEWYWRKISGPDPSAITYPSDSVTAVKSLIEGTYLFELKVTDSAGLFSKDTMQVSVINPLITSCGDTNRPHVNAQLIPFGTLSQARYEMAVASAGNKILFAGGRLLSNPLVRSSRVDIYDTTTQSWSTAELSVARCVISAIGAGNKIFFGGGEGGDGAHPVNTVDIYDVATNTWSVAALSEPGNSIATAAAGNKVFFAGGDAGVSAPREKRAENVDIYDLNTNTWSVAHLSEPRYGGISAVAVNDKVYFAGGVAGLDLNWFASDRIDIYDITSNSWSTSTLYEGKSYCGGISAGNKIFWAGGETGGGATTAIGSCVVEIKDVNSGSSIAYLSHPGSNQALLKNGKIVFLGGENTFDIYDITTGTWSIGVLPAARNPSSENIGVNNTIYGSEINVNGVLSTQVWKLEF